MSLVFEVDPDLQIPAEESFEVGGIGYKLLAVVFGDGSHFKCNVLLADTWYHYDDRTCRLRDNKPTQVSPLFLPITQGDHMKLPQPAVGFKPVVYRYVRMGATTLDPIKLTNAARVPTETQFNSMLRLV